MLLYRDCDGVIWGVYSTADKKMSDFPYPHPDKIKHMVGDGISAVVNSDVGVNSDVFLISNFYFRNNMP